MSASDMTSGPAQTIDETWDTIESELAVQFPQVHESLSPPATAYELDLLEGAMDRMLPPDFRASLLRHNGQRERMSLHGFCNSACLLGTDGILDVWHGWRNVADPSIMYVHPHNDTSLEIDTGVVWHPGWVPFTETDCGNYHFLDLAPRPRGTVGQIFFSFDAAPGGVLARSYREWLDRIASKLVARDYQRTLSEEFGSPWFNGFDV
jgi:cell wall assembly regulator SMI1